MLCGLFECGVGFRVLCFKGVLVFASLLSIFFVRGFFLLLLLLLLLLLILFVCPYLSRMRTQT